MVSEAAKPVRRETPMRRSVEAERCRCVEPDTGLRCEAVTVDFVHAGACYAVPRGPGDLPIGPRVVWKPARWPSV